MGELRQLNEQNKLAVWAERVTECRNSGQSVLAWCKEHGICSQTYYKWQKRLFTMAEAQHEVQFAEVTPITEMPLSQQARSQFTLPELLWISIRAQTRQPWKRYFGF